MVAIVLLMPGMDRIVRIWNPYVTSKPTGMLRGHSAPICYLFIAEEENRVFSISTDRCIRVKIRFVTIINYRYCIFLLVTFFMLTLKYCGESLELLMRDFVDDNKLMISMVWMCVYRDDT